jgi:hypothetical protein
MSAADFILAGCFVAGVVLAFVFAYYVWRAEEE